MLVVITFGTPDLLYLPSSSCTSREFCLFSSDSGWNCNQDQPDLWSLLISSAIRCWYHIDISASANTFAILHLMSSKFLWRPRQSFHYILQTHFHGIFSSLCSCSFSSDLSLTPILILFLHWSSSPCMLHVIKFSTNYALNFSSNTVIKDLKLFKLLFLFFSFLVYEGQDLRNSQDLDYKRLSEKCENHTRFRDSLHILK